MTARWIRHLGTQLALDGRCRGRLRACSVPAHPLPIVCLLRLHPCLPQESHVRPAGHSNAMEEAGTLSARGASSCRPCVSDQVCPGFPRRHGVGTSRRLGGVQPPVRVAVDLCWRRAGCCVTLHRRHWRCGGSHLRRRHWMHRRWCDFRAGGFGAEARHDAFGEARNGPQCRLTVRLTDKLVASLFPRLPS